MSEQRARQEVRRAELGVKVIRADGSEEDLGTVSSSRWWWRHGPGHWLAARRIRKANARVRAE